MTMSILGTCKRHLTVSQQHRWFIRLCHRERASAEAACDGIESRDLIRIWLSQRVARVSILVASFLDACVGKCAQHVTLAVDSAMKVLAPVEMGKSSSKLKSADLKELLESTYCEYTTNGRAVKCHSDAGCRKREQRQNHCMRFCRWVSDKEIKRSGRYSRVSLNGSEFTPFVSSVLYSNRADGVPSDLVPCVIGLGGCKWQYTPPAQWEDCLLVLALRNCLNARVGQTINVWNYSTKWETCILLWHQYNFICS